MEYKEAKKKVEDIKGFYIHLVVYLVIMTGLFFINYLSSPTIWFIYPLIGWGIAVAIHGAVLLFDDTILGKDWENQKVKEMMGKSHV